MAVDLRPPLESDREAIRSIAIDTNLFEAGDVGLIDDMLSAFLDRETSEHNWLVVDDSGVTGAAYWAPELAGDRVWNLYFIGVRPERQGDGHGSALLTAIEDELRSLLARVLIVETSGVSGFELTRRFYRKHGYDEEARIRGFYGPGRRQDRVLEGAERRSTASS